MSTEGYAYSSTVEEGSCSAHNAVESIMWDSGAIFEEACVHY